MIRFIHFALAFVVFMANLSAQHYEVVYDEIISGVTGTQTSEYHLLIDNKKSIYYQTNSELNKIATEEVIEKNKDVRLVYAKDFTSKEMVYIASLINSMKTIKEQIPLQQWHLSQETKKIGGYLCKKATTQFRGRNYTAWYTEDLPVLGGPWKFDGLAGLILEVASNDGYISIKARAISPQKGIFPTFPVELTKQNAISWEQYCVEFKSLIKRWEKSVAANANPGDEFKLSFEAIEDIGLSEVKVSK